MNAERIRDKYWDEKRPAFDLDRVEMQVYLSGSEFDSFLRKYAKPFVKWSDIDSSTLLKNRRKQDRLLKKIFKAASNCLTDRQFEIFVLRYKCLLKEDEIARQLKVDQSYIPAVLKACHKKIRRTLRLETRQRRTTKNVRKLKKKSPKNKRKTSVKKRSRKRYNK